MSYVSTISVEPDHTIQSYSKPDYVNQVNQPPDLITTSTVIPGHVVLDKNGDITRQMRSDLDVFVSDNVGSPHVVREKGEDIVMTGEGYPMVIEKMGEPDYTEQETKPPDYSLQNIGEGITQQKTVLPGFTVQGNVSIDYTKGSQSEQIINTQLNPVSHVQGKTGEDIHNTFNQPPPFTTKSLEDPDYIVKMKVQQDYSKTEQGQSDVNTIKGPDHLKNMTGSEWATQNKVNVDVFVTDNGESHHKVLKGSDWSLQNRVEESMVPSTGEYHHISEVGKDYALTGNGEDIIAVQKLKDSGAYIKQGKGEEIIQQLSNGEYVTLKPGVGFTVTDSGKSYVSTD